MIYLETLLIGVGLSMDAFAVAVAKGLSMPRLLPRQALVIALYFGGFQGLMPTLGWLVGTWLGTYVSAFGHYIAFVLLALIGGKMLWEAWKERDKEAVGDGEVFVLRHTELLILAVATSIDALMVGVSYAILSRPVFPHNLLIAGTTFLISLGGVAAGHFLGNRYEKYAGLAGGAILVLIGVKILLEGIM